MGFLAPKVHVPAAPPPPPAPPTPATPSVQQAGSNALQAMAAASGAGGLSDTILTSGQGAGAPATAQKTLTGA